MVNKVGKFLIAGLDTNPILSYVISVQCEHLLLWDTVQLSKYYTDMKCKFITPGIYWPTTIAIQTVLHNMNIALQWEHFSDL